MKEKLQTMLESIGYRLNHQGCEYYSVMDFDNKHTGYMYFGGRLYHEIGDCKGGATFYLKDCTIKYVGDDKKSIGISPKKAKDVFILFSNFRLK